MPTNAPEGYRPSNTEVFMNPAQVEYFRSKLLQLREGAQRELDGARRLVRITAPARAIRPIRRALQWTENSALLTASALRVC
jgi:hypothetical protein